MRVSFQKVKTFFCFIARTRTHHHQMASCFDHWQAKPGGLGWVTEFKSTEREKKRVIRTVSLEVLSHTQFKACL